MSATGSATPEGGGREVEPRREVGRAEVGRAEGGRAVPRWTAGKTSSATNNEKFSSNLLMYRCRYYPA